MTQIKFQDVSKNYGDRVVLRDFCLEIEAGERVVLHGPSGCGKTTVLRLLAGFIAPDSGTIWMGGRVVAKDRKIIVPPEARNVGMVFQDLALWPHMTVAGNLDYVLQTRGLSTRDRAARIADILARVHLKEFSNSYPSRLSGGQQQRVAIARALISRPQTLLMDEPLSNLDDQLREDLCSMLLELHSELGFTLVYVTHSSKEMGRIGERDILLRDGRREVLK